MVLSPAVSMNGGRVANARCLPQVDGTPVPVERLPSLEVVVVAVQLSMRDGELPVPVGEPVLHRDITSGRPGGAHPE